MAYQYKLTWYEVDDKTVPKETGEIGIKKGDRLLCTKSVRMDDGTFAYIIGKVYRSECDNCITGENADSFHNWSVDHEDECNWWDHFQQLPHPVETCGCDKCKGVMNKISCDHTMCNRKDCEDCYPSPKDRDYFQSTQEEYGKNEVIPPPNNGIPVLNSTEARIIEECNAIRDLLISKNRRYGDSALSRGNIFNMSPVISIKARIEDKLQRLKNLRPDDNEDVILDLLGYFILLRIAQKQEQYEKAV